MVRAPMAKLRKIATALCFLSAAVGVIGHGALLSPCPRNKNCQTVDGKPEAQFGNGPPNRGGFQSGNGESQHLPYGSFRSGFPHGSPCGDRGSGTYSINMAVPSTSHPEIIWHYGGEQDCEHDNPQCTFDGATFSSACTGCVPKFVRNTGSGTVMNYTVKKVLQNGENEQTYFTPGSTMDITLEITAYHGGQIGLYLCPWGDEPDFDYEACGIFGNFSDGDFPHFGTVQGANVPYNISSPYYMGMYSLPNPHSGGQQAECPTQAEVGEGDAKCNKPLQEYPGNWCANCEADKVDGTSIFCGFNQKYKTEYTTEPSLTAGCQGKDPYRGIDGAASLTLKKIPVPNQVTTDRAVLVWHWITNNQGRIGGRRLQGVALEGDDGATDANSQEMFMNCASMKKCPDACATATSRELLFASLLGGEEGCPQGC